MEANRPMLDLVSAMTSAMKAQDRLLSFFDEAGLRLKLELQWVRMIASIVPHSN